MYADWLMGRDHPRGELIVVQHARATHGDPDSRLRGDRELHLFQEYGTELLGDLLYLLDALRLDWQHGFIRGARVDCVGQPFLAHAVVSALLEHPSGRLLRHLNVRDGFDSADLVELAKRLRAPMLRTLAIDPSGPIDRGKLSLDGGMLPALEQLAIGVANRPLALRTLRMDHLHHLELACRFRPFHEGLVEEISAASLPALRTLILHGATDQEVDDLLHSPLAARLETLGLPDSKITTDAEVALEHAGFFTAPFVSLLKPLETPNLDAYDRYQEEEYEHLSYDEEP